MVTPCLTVPHITIYVYTMPYIMLLVPRVAWEDLHPSSIADWP